MTSSRNESPTPPTGHVSKRGSDDEGNLFAQVVGWVAAAMLLYAAAFWVLGWIYSGHPGWPGVHDKPQMYDLARSSVGVAGILGGAAAVAVALRRQKSTETTVRLDQRRTEYDRVTALRTRYTEAARQLGDDNAAVRLAGAYAMAALADDWIQRHDDITKLKPGTGKAVNWDSDAQACIDVLCAYIRTSRGYPGDRPAAPDLDGDPGSNIEQRADLEVRQTIIRITRDHLRKHASTGWTGFDLDYRGATFAGTYSFQGATFSGGRVSFDGATFSGGRVSFDGATFSGGRVSFDGATFSGHDVSFDEVTFSGGRVSFDWATFTEQARLSFYEATFSGGDVSFVGSTFSGGDVSFVGSTFSGGEVAFLQGQRVWDANYKAMFSGGTVHFGKATFSGGSVVFHATGGTVSFRGTGLTVPFGRDFPDSLQEAVRWEDERDSVWESKWESKKAFPFGPWGDRTPPWAPGEQWSWPLQPVSDDESS
ncbi:pentapeptide repeat-containing protein [Flexivirga sp. B27]